MPESRWPKFTWDPDTRRYRNAGGRLVGRREVRQALDEVIDAAGERIRLDSRRLQAGQINLPEWHLRLESHIKLIHASAAAGAAGGWAQATSRDWAEAGQRIKSEYKYLYAFSRELEAGLPLDNRFLARAQQYAGKGSQTFEKISRRLDIATGLVLQERRLIRSGNPCEPCLGYERKGWVNPGVLPGIGEKCLCKQNCRCAFERKMRPPKKKPKTAAQKKTADQQKRQAEADRLAAEQAALQRAQVEAEQAARLQAEKSAQQARAAAARKAAAAARRTAAEARKVAERKAEEDRKAAELKAREEADRKAREEEAARKEAARKAAAEKAAKAAARKQAQREAAARRIEEARRKAEEEARRFAEEQARKAREEAERARLAREEAARKAAEEAAKKAAEEAAKKVAEQARRKAEEAAAKAAAKATAKAAGKATRDPFGRPAMDKRVQDELARLKKEIATARQEEARAKAEWDAVKNDGTVRISEREARQNAWRASIHKTSDLEATQGRFEGWKVRVKDNPNLIPPFAVPERIDIYRNRGGDAKLKALASLQSGASDADRAELARLEIERERVRAKILSLPSGPQKEKAYQELFEVNQKRSRIERLAERGPSPDRVVAAIGVGDPVDLRPVYDNPSSIYGPLLPVSGQMKVKVEEGARFFASITSAAGLKRPLQARFGELPPGDPNRSNCRYQGISMEPNAGAQVVVHELGHHIDNHLDVDHASREFLKHRVGDEPNRKLKDVFPGSGYKDNEVGRKDKFDQAMSENRAWYAGKDYGSSSSEITSMGIEQLYFDAANFAIKDPEYAAFILGALDGSLR